MLIADCGNSKWNIPKSEIRNPKWNIPKSEIRFHMSIEELDIASALKNGGKYIGYIHLADSNRMEPGAGHTDFASGIATLKSIGYDGWLTIESGASSEPEDALSRANDFIRHLWDAS